MKFRKHALVLLGLGVFSANIVWAGKTEDIQAAVKKTCQKDIPPEQALRLVKDLFLSCSEGTKVEVESGCSVDCMKSAGGKVVGQ